jgi:hypothetical protein
MYTYRRSQIFELCHIFKTSVTYLHVMILPINECMPILSLLFKCRGVVQCTVYSLMLGFLLQRVHLVKQVIEPRQVLI